MLLLFTSFIAGVLTVLAPCVLPILPIIIGSSASSNNKKSTFILIGSLSISIVLFTLLLRASTLLIHIPNSTWTTVSGFILIIFGGITLFPSLWEHLSGKMNASSKHLLEGAAKQTGWKREAAIGFALGPVFNSCSPTYSLILATVLPVNFLQGIVYTIVYALGLACILALIALLGSKITSRLRSAADPQGRFKRVLGILLVVIGFGIVFGWDKSIEAFIIEQGYFGITNFEEELIQQLR